MNKIFKVIWNPATGSYTVASETAKSRGKKSGRSKLLISALVAGGLLSSFGASADNYTGQPTDYGDGSAGDGWVAIGKGAKANTFMNTSGASTALGYDAIAEGEYSSAIGSKTLATGGASMAFGVSAKAMGDRSVALGASSVANGDRSMAFGRYAKTNGFTSLAIGDSSLADGEKTIALGNTAKAYEIMSIALGDNANASKEYAMALGASSKAGGADSLAFGRKSTANSTGSLAIGADSSSSNDNAIAIGNKTQALGVNSMALGNASQASGESSIALGNTSEASEQNAIALGQGSIASKVNSIALGSNSLSSGENAIALGEGSAAGGSNSLAFGSQSRANGNDSVAIGVGAAAATDNSVAIGAGSTTDASNTVSVGNSATKRKIVNMAAGAISNTSTDAINGSQLYTISDSVAKRLGGGATVGSDGTVTAVSYALRSGTYNNVGDALSGIDNNTLQWNKTAGAFSANHGANATNKITNVAKGTVSATSTDVVNGSQLYDLQQDALLWNGTAFSAAHGTEATSKITNVTAGNLTAGSTDAVNGSQLKTTNDNVTTNTTNIATNTTNITNLTDAVNGLGDDSLLWNKAAGAFSAAHGTEATSKITNVTAGNLTAGLRVNPEFQDFSLCCYDYLVKCFTLSSQRRRIIGIPIFCTSTFLIFFSVCCFFTLFAAFAHKTVLFCILKDLHKANNVPKVISKSFIVEVSMSDVLRPYRDLFPQIGQRVMIDDSSVVIGDVRLADDVGIWPLVVIRGDVHYVQIGARTNIQDGSMLHVTHKSSYNPAGNPLTIGEDVTVGHKVMLHGCTIGNRVLVGMGSILLDGAIVEDDVMIGAGSLVPQNKRLESGYLYLGSPVKQIRPLSDEEKAGLRYSANNYVKWKDEYMDQGNHTQP